MKLYPLIIFIAVAWFISRDYDVPTVITRGHAVSAATSEQARIAHINGQQTIPHSAKELISKITEYHRIGVDSSVLVNARGYVYREGKYVPAHFQRNTAGMRLWIKGDRVRSWSEQDSHSARLNLFNNDPLSLVARTYTGELIYLKYFSSRAEDGVAVYGFTGWILPDGDRVDSPALPIAVVSEQIDRTPAATDGRISLASQTWPQPTEISPYMRWLEAY